MITTANILWIDDEIDSLKSQIMFLENKGYKVHTLSNGYDALDFIKENQVDVVLLDESMPGITGLETLSQIREINRLLPIVMVTKNEAENIMEEAIGSQITDYLIKPVNPNQVLLSLKKILESKNLVSEKTTHAYQMEFRNLFMAFNDNPNFTEWTDIYKKFVFWELEIQKADSPEMMDVYNTQKQEANNEFCKFVDKNYIKWVQEKKQENRPIMSDNLMKLKVFPHLQKGTPLFFVLIDNLRFDQWKTIEPIVNENFRIIEEDSFYAILPTSTQYSRNAIFAGMMPLDIQRKFPTMWFNDEEEGGKNLHEADFFADQLKSMGKSDLKFSYTKITNHRDGQALVDNIGNMLHNDINIIVYNFVDMLSHARTEMEVLKELAPDEMAYRSLTQSWFTHSPLFDALKKIDDKNMKMVIATDHGSTRVRNAHKVIGDKQTTSNIRYKNGKNLQFDNKDVLVFSNPDEAGLPKPNFNSKYIFAKEDGYLCYPNNYNHFASYFKNTFQHGGVSLEECIIPVITLENK